MTVKLLQHYEMVDGAKTTDLYYDKNLKIKWNRKFCVYMSFNYENALKLALFPNISFRKSFLFGEELKHFFHFANIFH